MTESLKYLSENVLMQLSENVENNVQRYTEEGFADYRYETGWGLALKSVDVDEESFSGLVGDNAPESEIKNSLIVFNALKGMTPSLACEERIWTRLAHIECIEYSRDRWLKGKKEEELVPQIKLHFFAKNKRGRTHNNAISRLWWNAYIAKLANPENIEDSLNIILQKADIRQSIIERVPIISRPKIAGATIRAFTKYPWLIQNEQNWRDFITAVNKYGGGILFEAMNDDEIDAYMHKCLKISQQNRT